MHINTTRRALLKAAPIAAATVATPAAAISIGSSPDRSAWHSAMRAYEQANAEADAFGPIHREIHDRWEAGQPSEDSIHWKEFWPSGHIQPRRRQVAYEMDLEQDWQRFLDAENVSWFGPNHDAIKARRRAALDSVQAYRDAVKRNRRESGMDAAQAKMTALEERAYAAEAALMDTPAPDLAALKWKLDRIFDFEDDYTASWSRDWVRQTLADIAGLLPHGA